MGTVNPLYVLTKGEMVMSKEEFSKMKTEWEQRYSGIENSYIPIMKQIKIQAIEISDNILQRVKQLSPNNIKISYQIKIEKEKDMYKKELDKIIS